MTDQTDLTQREREIVSLVSCGLSNAEIGRRAGITEGTTKVFLNQIFSKCNVTSRAQLIVLELTGGRPWEA